LHDPAHGPVSSVEEYVNVIICRTKPHADFGSGMAEPHKVCEIYDSPVVCSGLKALTSWIMFVYSNGNADDAAEGGGFLQPLPATRITEMNTQILMT